MIADVNRDAILSDSINYLEQSETNESTLVKKLPFLSYFAEEITGSIKPDERSEKWIEQLVFGFCMKYFSKNFTKSPLWKDCYKLMICSCKGIQISEQILKKCKGLIESMKENVDRYEDMENDPLCEKLPLDFIVGVIKDIFGSYGNMLHERLIGLKQDIIKSLTNLIGNEDISDSYFILICGVLKDMLDVDMVTEMEVIYMLLISSQNFCSKLDDTN